MKMISFWCNLHIIDTIYRNTLKLRWFIFFDENCFSHKNYIELQSFSVKKFVQSVFHSICRWLDVLQSCPDELWTAKSADFFHFVWWIIFSGSTVVNQIIDVWIASEWEFKIKFNHFLRIQTLFKLLAFHFRNHWNDYQYN